MNEGVGFFKIFQHGQQLDVPLRVLNVRTHGKPHHRWVLGGIVQAAMEIVQRLIHDLCVFVEDIDICFVRRRQRLPEMKQEEAQAHAHQRDHCHHDRPPEGIQENSVVPRYNPMGHFTYLLQILMAKL